MPTPVGHLLAGGAVGAGLARDREPRDPIALAGLCALLPDLDFIPGALVGDPGRFHHTFSHSVFVALAVALAVVLLVRRDRWLHGLIAGGGYASHLLLDMLVVDPLPPRGMALFWPLSSVRVHAPLSLLPSVDHTGAMMTLRNLAVGATEMLLFGLLLLWAVSRSRRPADVPGGAAEPLDDPGRPTGF